MESKEQLFPDGILMMVFNNLEILEMIGHVSKLNKNTRKLLARSKIIDSKGGLKINLQRLDENFDFRMIKYAIKLSSRLEITEVKFEK